MSKIMVYKSDHTGELFEHKKDYDRHLRIIREEIARVQKIREAADALENRWIAFRAMITDVSQLPQAIIDHQDLFWETASRQTSDFEICKKTGIYPKLIEFTEFNLTYSDCVSNSHSCPKDGITNWGGQVKGAPRGYPGWSGRICWISEWPDKYGGHYPGSRLLKGSRIHTGSGGTAGCTRNGCVGSGYGVELFLSDWKELEKSLFIKRLKGKRI